nr:MAG TPA_asm: hypothetical protein [Caudoviricetes sp.]
MSRVFNSPKKFSTEKEPKRGLPCEVDSRRPARLVNNEPCVGVSFIFFSFILLQASLKHRLSDALLKVSPGRLGIFTPLFSRPAAECRTGSALTEIQCCLVHHRRFYCTVPEHLYESTFGQILEELPQGAQVVSKPELVGKEVLTFGVKRIDYVTFLSGKALKQAHVSAVSIWTATPDKATAGGRVGEVRVVAEILERSCGSRLDVNLCDLSPCHRENS